MLLNTYLKYINPIVAVIICLICFYAASYDKDEFCIGRMFEGGFGSYFVAKGMFCGLAIFLLGKILEVMLRHQSCQQKNAEPE